jgi:penicillin-binding protein 1A
MTKLLKIITFITITGIALVAVGFSGAYLYLSPSLPDADSLTDIKLQIPLRIYSADGKLLGEFGEKKRTPVKIKDVPLQLINAFLAAEDDRFYKHKGFSTRGFSRGVWQAISGSSTQSGGSTITMQVIKNYLLSSERTIIRKLKELFLSVQIERILTKDQILELYLNKIFLGHQAYGIAAAAQVYYGKSLEELDLAEMAVIAGLPKAPSTFNPIVNPERAKIRRDWILRRMLSLGYIDKAAFDMAIKMPISAKKHKTAIELDASDAAELVRQEVLALYGEDAYTEGYRVITTIDSHLQETALASVRKGLHEYDKRHGYRKPEAHLTDITPENKKALFQKTLPIADIVPAIVIDNQGKEITAEFSDGTLFNIAWENGLSTAKKYISENRFSQSPKLASDIVEVGDLIRVSYIGEAWHLTQIPKIEAALISLDPHDGSIYAIIGGYGFYNSKFNRATQAKRLIGSNIKPFIYSYALDNGYTAATLINDSPVLFKNRFTGVEWKPSNDDDKYLGPTRLRQALYRSRNVVSVKILESLGIKNTVDYLTKFGFDKKALPQEMSLALGTASFSPTEVATAYAAFANQGFKISPYIIETVYNDNNEIIFQAMPEIVCKTCIDDESAAENTRKEASSIEELLAKENETEELASIGGEINTNYAKRIIDEKVVFIIDSILSDTIKRGTARKALSLQRSDIAGKTATTNGPTDSWFSGYHRNIITTVWSGFDNNPLIGKDEYGSTIALPIWIDFMDVALKNQPVIYQDPPAGIVSVLINSTNGKRTAPGDPDSMFEYIQEDLLYKIEPADIEANQATEQIESIF